jgi:hypothetical protein
MLETRIFTGNKNLTEFKIITEINKVILEINKNIA